MGTVIAIMSTYYILNGQAGKAVMEAMDWIKEKLPEPEDKNDK